MARTRGDRYRAYVDNECIYWTDSQKGMRDQCVRLLEYRFKDDTIVVSDTLDNEWSRSVNAETVWDWRV